jgi:hypothetical protein
MTIFVNSRQALALIFPARAVATNNLRISSVADPGSGAFDSGIRDG